MPVLPSKLEEQISFGEAHSTLWNTNAAAIGLTPAQATAIKTIVGTTRQNFTAAQVARGAAKSATKNQTSAASSMRTQLGDAIKAIRLFAESTNNPNVYALADIPAPAAPAPAPAPSQPTNISAEIVPGGALKVIFKATNRSGSGPVTYIINRKLATETAFRTVGTTGSSRTVRGLPRGFKAFIDETLPSGANNFQYQIQGQRGDAFGEASEIFTVVIGNGARGESTQSTTVQAATSSGSFKMAA